MPLCAATLIGFGGLLAAMVVLHRSKLHFGDSAELSSCVAVALVIAFAFGALVLARWKRLQMRARLSAGLFCVLSAVAIGMDWAELQAEPQFLGPVVAGVPLTEFVYGLTALGLAAVGIGGALSLLCVVAGRSPSLWGLFGSLLGALFASFLGGEFLLPGLGYAQSELLATFALAVAAMLLLVPHGSGQRQALGSMAPARGIGIACVAAFVVGGYAEFLLRRLPWHLEDLTTARFALPSACLLGALAGTGIVILFGAWFRRSTLLKVALCATGIAIACGLPEFFAPSIAAFDASSLKEQYSRALLLAVLLVGLPSCCLGIIVAMLLRTDDEAPDLRIAAGRILAVSSMALLAGVLLSRHLLPRLWSPGLPILAPLCFGLLAVLVGTWRTAWLAGVAVPVVAIVGSLGLSGAGPLWEPAPLLPSSEGWASTHLPLASRRDSSTTVAALYHPAAHRRLLLVNGVIAGDTAETYRRALGLLPSLLSPVPVAGAKRELAVIGVGVGVTALAALRAPAVEAVHLVEKSSAQLSLLDRFAGDGPVRPYEKHPVLSDRRTRVHKMDGRAWLRRRPTGSLDQLIINQGPSQASSFGSLCSSEACSEIRRVLRPEGLMIVSLPLASMPREAFVAVLASLARSFEHSSVWLLPRQVLILGSAEPHLGSRQDLQRGFACLSDLARASLHVAGLCGVEDLEAAWVGDRLMPLLNRARRLSDDRPLVPGIEWARHERREAFYRENLEVLSGVAALSSSFPQIRAEARSVVKPSPKSVGVDRIAGLIQFAGEQGLGRSEDLHPAMLRFKRARTTLPNSVVLHREETLLLRSYHERRVREMDSRNAARVARSALARDQGSAWLQATSGIDATESKLRHAAGRRALAVDPSFYTELHAEGAQKSGLEYIEAIMQTEPTGARASILADISTLPVEADLIELLLHSKAQQVELCVAFPVAVAQALIHKAAKTVLSQEEAAVLRTVLDPVSFVQYAHRVAQRSGDPLVEIGPVWRRDLSIPAELSSLQSGDMSTRVGLAKALAGRRGKGACRVLADLLEDQAVEVRRAAGVSLYKSFGQQIVYDPTWDEGRRSRAARTLRALHLR